MHPIQMKPIHQKNISNCFLFLSLFCLCTTHIHTTGHQPNWQKQKNTFFSNNTINLRSFSLFIFLFVCRCQHFRLYLFFFLSVCVGCNQFFSLAVYSFSSSTVRLFFFCLFMCHRHRMSHVENKKRKKQNNLHTFKKKKNQTLSIHKEIFNIEIDDI
jgi:hypothetical protein